MFSTGIKTPVGIKVMGPGLQTLSRLVDDAQPAACVFVDIAGRDLGSYVAEAKRLIAERVQMRLGYHTQWSGQIEFLHEANRRLSIGVPIALLLLVLLLYRSNGRWFRVGVILLAVPFSLIGAFWFLWALDFNRSLAVGVGIIAMPGVEAATGQVMLLYLDTTY